MEYFIFAYVALVAIVYILAIDEKLEVPSTKTWYRLKQPVNGRKWVSK